MNRMIAGQSKVAQFLLEHNRRQSATYVSPDATLARRMYRSKHPTEIAALKCMDGRLNLPVITETPPGIIQPFRNVGGRFDFGWPFFGQLIQEWVEYAVKRGRDCIILITYHWSKGDPHRGCKGFDYCVENAQGHTAWLKAQAERIYGAGHSVVYPIQVGVETDEDALVLHGANGEVLDLSAVKETNPDELRITVKRMFPGMRKQMIDDLMPLILGNLHHIGKLREKPREFKEYFHGEDTIALGRGFSWLHIPNKALIVGPFSYDLATPIVTAAQIVYDNLESGRIPKDDGAVFMVSALSRELIGPEGMAAREKAKSLADFGVASIRAKVPELMPHLDVLVGVVDGNTMLFTPQPYSIE